MTTGGDIFNKNPKTRVHSGPGGSSHSMNDILGTSCHQKTLKEEESKTILKASENTPDVKETDANICDKENVSVSVESSGTNDKPSKPNVPPGGHTTIKLI